MNKILKLNTKLSMITKFEKDEFINKIEEIHKSIRNKTGKGNEFMDWLDWPQNYDSIELNNIISKSTWMKEQGIETLLVIGIGGSFLGSKSAIDFILGKIEKQDDVLFAGINFSSSHIKQLEKKLLTKKWAICVISKSGTTLEPALAFRHFKKILENKVGIEMAKKLIVVITDKEKGLLKKLSIKNQYESYIVPNGIGGRFSGTTPVGTFPMAFAGINVKKMLSGAKQAMIDFSTLENNLAYEYALTRYILHTKKNKDSEIFTTYDFDLDMIGEWWKQLFGESEGKDGKGIMPISVSYSRDLHSLGQIIQDGKQIFFETTLWIDNDIDKLEIEEDLLNIDKLNYLKGKTFHEINKIAFEAVVKAHNKKIPNIIITLQDKTEYSLGYLWYFFFISVTMSSYLMDVNPFDQPGVELYKKNMFDILKK